MRRTLVVRAYWNTSVWFWFKRKIAVFVMPWSHGPNQACTSSVRIYNHGFWPHAHHNPGISAWHNLCQSLLPPCQSSLGRIPGSVEISVAHALLKVARMSLWSFALIRAGHFLVWAYSVLGFLVLTFTDSPLPLFCQVLCSSALQPKK